MVHRHLDGVSRLVLIHFQGATLRGATVEFGQNPAVPDPPFRILRLNTICKWWRWPTVSRDAKCVEPLKFGLEKQENWWNVNYVSYVLMFVFVVAPGTRHVAILPTVFPFQPPFLAPKWHPKAASSPTMRSLPSARGHPTIWALPSRQTTCGTLHAPPVMLPLGAFSNWRTHPSSCDPSGWWCPNSPRRSDSQPWKFLKFDIWPPKKYEKIRN